MSNDPSFTIKNRELERLKLYGSALRDMRFGKFGAFSPPRDIGSPIDAFGHELAELGNWLEHRFEEFRMFQELSVEIGSELFAENVLDRIYKSFSKLIPYDRIGCALLEDNGQRLSAFWAKADYPDLRITKNYSARMAGSSLETILVTGQPRIINDLRAYLEANPQSKATRAVLAEGIQSNLTCPLIANGKPIGFLFFSSREKNAYRGVHPDTFLQIAGQVSVLIEKSLLYQQLYDLNEKLVDAHQQLKEQAMHDALTGILNRGAIMELLQKTLKKAQRESTSAAVIMADLDHFKAINDGYGHIAGDDVLRTSAQAIKNSLRGYDHVGRYGGEEFLIVLDGADVQTATQVAERVRACVEALDVSHEGTRIATSLSLGVAVSAHTESADAVISRADTALYRAKQSGRNRYCLASPD